MKAAFWILALLSGNLFAAGLDFTPNSGSHVDWWFVLSGAATSIIATLVYLRAQKHPATNPLFDSEGNLIAFEIDNTFVTPRRVIKVIDSIDEAEIVLKRRALPFRRVGTFCEFLLDGTKFLAEEPFGDNSRYWIGPENDDESRNIEKLYTAFK